MTGVIFLVHSKTLTKRLIIGIFWYNVRIIKQLQNIWGNSQISRLHILKFCVISLFHSENEKSQREVQIEVRVFPSNYRIRQVEPATLPYFLIILFYFFKVQLIYSVLSISVVQQNDPAFLFLYYLPSWSIPRDCLQFLLLCSRTSLLINSKCNSLHLLTPNSQSIPYIFLNTQ